MERNATEIEARGRSGKRLSSCGMNKNRLPPLLFRVQHVARYLRLASWGAYLDKLPASWGLTILREIVRPPRLFKVIWSPSTTHPEEAAMRRRSIAPAAEAAFPDGDPAGDVRVLARRCFSELQ